VRRSIILSRIYDLKRDIDMARSHRNFTNSASIDRMIKKWKKRIAILLERMEALENERDDN
jgi:hypothetical protein